MSEYLIKKAVLDHMKSRIEWFRNRSKEWQKQGVASKQKEMYEASIALEEFVSEIRSGAFDADDSEIHRLLAAAIKLHETLNTYWQGGCEKEVVVAAQSHLCDVLSTTTEPTRAEQVREVVAWFAQQMEAKLRENDHKGGWQDCSLDWLIERLYKEAQELWIEVDRIVPEPERIIREAADVANFAMMIADIARRINAPEKVETED